MRHIDQALPVMAPSVSTDPVPPQRPTREELIEVLARIGKEARLPPGIKNAHFVRVSSELYREVHDLVLRELASHAATHPAEAA